MEALVALLAGGVFDVVGVLAEEGVDAVAGDVACLADDVV